MSTLFVNKLKAAVGSVINLPSGQRIKSADTGGIVAPGTLIQCQVQTRTIGNTSHDADIESVTISSTPGLDNATTLNTVSITPKFNNSKILMQWSGQLQLANASSHGVDIFFTKDDSNLLSSGGNRNSIGFSYKAFTGEIYSMNSAQLSFTANQTTSMTLKVEVNRYNTTGSVGLQHDGSTTLTVWEIAQ